MEHATEKSLIIKSLVNQTPFEDEAVRSFFDKWCSINDSITPRYLSREEWEEEKTTGILKSNPDKTKILYIPRDLRLWEMVGIMETVDKDTFYPESQKGTKKARELGELGKMFQNTAVYIAHRIDYLDLGRDIAEGLSQEFYKYGQRLQTGIKLENEPTIKEISYNSLGDEETKAVDRWLASDSLYSSRKKRVDRIVASEKDGQLHGVLRKLSRPSVDKDQLTEEVRKQTLNQFFRTAKKALLLEREKKLSKKTLPPPA